MKIAWFTPYSQESAIGRCSQSIVRELSRFAEVEIWCPEQNHLREAEARVRKFSAALARPADLKHFDFCVYNFGNHVPNHRDIFEVSRRVPGICILHDFVMHHFFAEYFLSVSSDSESYKKAMERWYGEEGRIGATQSISSGGQAIWEMETVGSYPLFEETMRGHYGVVVHSSFFRDKVRSCFSGPIAHLSLPYEYHAGAGAKQQPDIASDTLLIVTAGHANPNKRIHDVIAALGRIRDRVSPFLYVVLGPCDPAYERVLLTTAAQHRLADAFKLAGYVSDNVLAGYLNRADVCVALRHPITEGASASVIEAMLSKTPAIVTNAGFYLDLPDDCVLKIEPPNPSESERNLDAALLRLLKNPELRSDYANRAFQYASRTFRADAYVRGFLRFVDEVGAAKLIFALADRLGAELNRMGVDSSMPVVQTVSREAAALFGEPSE